MVVLRLEKLLKSSHASAGARNRVRVGFGIEIFDFLRSDRKFFGCYEKARVRVKKVIFSQKILIGDRIAEVSPDSL